MNAGDECLLYAFLQLDDGFRRGKVRGRIMEEEITATLFFHSCKIYLSGKEGSKRGKRRKAEEESVLVVKGNLVAARSKTV